MSIEIYLGMMPVVFILSYITLGLWTPSVDGLDKFHVFLGSSGIAMLWPAMIPLVATITVLILTSQYLLKKIEERK